MVFVCLANIIVDYGTNIMDNNLEVIEETIMLEANTMCCALGDVNNTFGYVLQQGERLKSHGLTPVYYFHRDTMSLSVEAKGKEKFN
jgi:hypothetical protein